MSNTSAKNIVWRIQTFGRGRAYEGEHRAVREDLLILSNCPCTICDVSSASQNEGLCSRSGRTSIRVRPDIMKAQSLKFWPSYRMTRLLLPARALGSSLYGSRLQRGAIPDHHRGIP